MVSVYAMAPLCAEAQQVAAGADEVGGVKVRVLCLGPTKEGGGRLDLAAIGAGARRAVEDSTSVAYLAEDEPASTYAEPILDEAEVPTITGDSGSRSMHEVLTALSDRNSNETPRASVWAVR